MTAHARKHQIIKISPPENKHTNTHKYRKVWNTVFCVSLTASPSQHASCPLVTLRSYRKYFLTRGCIIQLLLTLWWPRAELCWRSLLQMKLLLSWNAVAFWSSMLTPAGGARGEAFVLPIVILPCPLLRNDLKSAGKSKSRRLQKTNEGQAMLWWQNTIQRPTNMLRACKTVKLDIHWYLLFTLRACLMLRNKSFRLSPYNVLRVSQN